MPDAHPTDDELLAYARTAGLVEADADVLPARLRTRALALLLNHRAGAAEPSGPDGEALTVQVVVSLAGVVLGQSTITIPLETPEPHHE